MSQRRLKKRTPSASLLGLAVLNGYKLYFDKPGIDGSSKADCRRSNTDSSFVMGGLFELDNEERYALDFAEGVGKHYAAKVLEVNWRNTSIKALTYVALTRKENLLPYTWYIKHIIEGAIEIGLPSEYIQELRSTRAMLDQDIERQRLELSVYN